MLLQGGKNLEILLKVTLVSFFLFSFLLPLHTRLSNIFLIISLLLCFVESVLGRHGNDDILGPRALLYTTLPLFALIVFGLLYSGYADDGYRFIEKSISFLVAPLVLLRIGRHRIAEVSQILLKGLVTGSMVSILYLLCVSLTNYFVVQDDWHIRADLLDYYHTHTYFTAPLAIHPTYLGVYYLTAFIFLGRVVKASWFKRITAVIILLSVPFLNSRIIFAVVVFILLCRAFQLFYSWYRLGNYKRILSTLIALTVGVALVVVLLSRTYVGYRFRNITRVEMSLNKEENTDRFNKANPRLARWASAWRLIEKKPVFGYGTADEYPNLKKQFEADGLFQAAALDYNSHNQYLGYAIRFGMAGVLLLLFFLIANIRLAWHTGNIDYLLLIVVICGICVFENFMDRNYGITFTAAFFTVLSYSALFDNRVAKNTNN